VLDEAGFEDVPIYSPNQDQEMYEELGILGDTFVKMAWRGVLAVDFMEKALWEIRPEERNAGDTDKVYGQFLIRICDEIRQGNEDFLSILKEARAAFEAVPRSGADGRPVVGIVGEIYIRSNPFSNEQVIRRLEALGAKVWLPPVTEWLLYINAMSKRHALQEHRWGNYLRTILKERIQKRDEHRAEEMFEGLVRNLHEPAIEQTLRWASPYVHDSFEGETVLSIGKAADFFHKGVSGVLNVGPFTCMPGTIVNAILKRFREEHDQLPVLNLFFDGQGETGTQTRLEAFMYQVQQYQEKRRAQG
jgi:predicted nucleotide-binding protein (sugar kinase/HSP70/actin superfamily)